MGLSLLKLEKSWAKWDELVTLGLPESDSSLSVT